MMDSTNALFRPLKSGRIEFHLYTRFCKYFKASYTVFDLKKTHKILTVKKVNSILIAPMTLFAILFESIDCVFCDNVLGKMKMEFKKPQLI